MPKTRRDALLSADEIQEYFEIGWITRRVLINGYASPGANRRDYSVSGVGRRLRAPAGFSCWR